MKNIAYTDAVTDLILVAGGVSALLIELGLSDDAPTAVHLQDGLGLLGSALHDAVAAVINNQTD